MVGLIQALFNRELFLGDTPVVVVPEPGDNVVVEASTEPQRTRYRMPRDAVVECTVTNMERDSKPHLVHVHVNHFQVRLENLKRWYICVQSSNGSLGIGIQLRGV